MFHWVAIIVLLGFNHCFSLLCAAARVYLYFSHLPLKIKRLHYLDICSCLLVKYQYLVLMKTCLHIL